jgi:DNA primase
VAQGLDITSLDGRARMSKLALPYIRQLPEGVYRQLMFQALAERTGLELSSLMLLETPAPGTGQSDYGSAPDYEPYPDDDGSHGPDRERPDPGRGQDFAHQPPPGATLT